MTKVCPSALLNRSAVTRAIVSVTPPTPYGTTTFTVRAGHCCARPGIVAPASETNAPITASSLLVLIAMVLRRHRHIHRPLTQDAGDARGRLLMMRRPTGRLA